VVNDGGANLDFRVEGDTDANTLFVDAGNNRVGIGTSTPTYKLDVEASADGGSFVAEIVNTNSASDGRGILNLVGNSSGAVSTLVFAGGRYFGTDNDTMAVINNAAAGGISFCIGGIANSTRNERARITSGGYFKASNIGSYEDASNPYHELRNNDSGDLIAVFTHTDSTNPFGLYFGFQAATPNNTTNYFLQCADSTNAKCYIYSSGTISNRTGTYNTISDLKLKQDIVDANSQWDDIKALRIVKYRLKDEVAADPNYPSYIGVIAQEVEQVSPGLVDNCPDFEEVEITDEEGNITTERRPTGTVTKSVKSSIIYMKAVKALQEAIERIETLEAKVAQLEANRL
jgi:hypothetical protein